MQRSLILLVALMPIGGAHAQCVGVTPFSFQEGCGMCTSMTVPVDAGVGDLVILLVGLDGLTSVVDAGTGWNVMFRRAPVSQFSTWVLTRTVATADPPTYLLSLQNVVSGGSYLVTSYRNAALTYSSVLTVAQDVPPASPQVNAFAGDVVVDLLVTDTNNPAVSWGSPPAGTCGRKLSGRIAYLDQVRAAGGAVPQRSFSITPEVADETTGFALVLSPLLVDAGSTDAGTPDAGSPDAGTPDAGSPDAGASIDGGVDGGRDDDAGVTPGPQRVLTVGCGCGSPGMTLPLLLVFALAVRRRGALLLLLLYAPVSSAQVIADDFESGLGAWSPTPCSPQTLTVSAAAAHRGASGLRLRDTSSSEACQGAAITRAVPAQATDMYTRAWVHFQTPPSSGAALLLDVGWDPIGGGAHGWKLDGQNELFAVRQSVPAAEYLATGVGPAPRDGGWVLLEGCTIGRGTTGTTAVYAIDGVEVARQTFSGLSSGFIGLSVGEVFASPTERSFTATVDFDDVRADTRPMASRLTLRPMTPPRVGECTAMVLALEASLPGPQPPLAPYDVQVAGDRFFRDATCAIAEPTPTIPQGASEVSLFVRPSTTPLRASHLDFVSATLDVGGSDGGDADKSFYALGCTSGGGGLALVIALLPLCSRRASSPRRRPRFVSRA